MGALGLINPRPSPSGQRYGGSNPVRLVKDTLTFGSTIRGFVWEGFPLMMGIAFLYDKAFMEGEDRSWGLGDLFVVWVLAAVLIRTSAVARWL